MINAEPVYLPMLESYRSLNAYTLGVYCLTFWMPPLGAVIGALMTIKPAMTTHDLDDLMNNTRTIYELPSWVNQC